MVLMMMMMLVVVATILNDGIGSYGRYHFFGGGGFAGVRFSDHMYSTKVEIIAEL